MKNRIDVINFILKVEEKFDVNSWIINEVKIWPVVRVKLFLAIISKLENYDTKRLTPKKKSNNQWVIIFKSLISSPLLFIFFKKLKNKKYLFFGSDNHRINYKGKRYNRFFDTIINQVKIKNRSYVFDCGQVKSNNIYNNEIFHALDPYIFTYFNLYRIKLKFNSLFQRAELIGYDKFISFLKLNTFTFDLTYFIEKEVVKITFNDHYIKAKFFEKILLTIKPEKVFMLNYYSDKFFALNNACFNIGVETIDLQHGPQSFSHAAYGNWSVVPENGYELLPQTFWLWDDYSFKSTNNWTQYNSHHKSMVYGNPWVDYFKMNSEFKFISKDEFILYTLQPLSIDELFPDQILRIIDELDNKWFLRLHPLQFKEKDNIINFFKKKNLINKIEINLASEKPLPELLSNCLVHVSNFSGCIIEASLLNKFSIILHEIGRDNFSELINLNKAVFVSVNNLTIQKFNLIISENISFVGDSQSKTFYDYFKSDS
mgnify:CR=1 FL=1